jgi:intracellular sulfur oxidation DsrE/DsrF family protein
MVNLLNNYGVKLQPGDIVITLHGQAAKTVLTPAAFAKRNDGAANPDAEILKQLAAAGVSIRLCGQSMMALGYTSEELNPVVKVDVAAITTMATLQLQGYAVIQD